MFLSSTFRSVVLRVTVEPSTVRSPEITVLPPTYKFSAIPAPPPTMSAPVVELVDVVVLATFTPSVSDKFNFAPSVSL